MRHTKIFLTVCQLLQMHGMRKVNVSTAVPLSVTRGFAQVVSIVVRTVTEPIATKHGTAKTVVIVSTTRMINVTIATSALQNAVTAITDVIIAVKKAITFVLDAGKSVLNVQRTTSVQNVENTVKTVPTIGAITVR